MPEIALGEITIDVVYKDIKNAYLSVYPPAGIVRISAPLRLDLDTIRVFAVSKLGWIQKQQKRLREQERESSREFIDRESHFYLGKRYLLRVSEVDSAPKVTLQHNTIDLQIRPGADLVKKAETINEWYRQGLKEVIPPMIERWEKKLNVVVSEFGIKKMKTKWGSCNQRDRRIWLNLELAKKPLYCVEYVVVHEMVHLIEPNHGERFKASMDKALPMWKSLKEELNKGLLGHQDWKYCS